MERLKDNKTVHYDKVTNAWQYIFGQNFHFGYFITPKLSLEEATRALNDELINLGKPDADDKVLDVGCGIGSPALYLNENFGCFVVGISTSHKGVNIANARSHEKKQNSHVRFIVADGIDHRLPDNHFDFVWLMESSHTMKDKDRLFKACFRTLKPGGRLLLGDVMPCSHFKPVHYLKNLCQWGGRYPIGLIKMRRSFGPAWTEPLNFYTTVLKRNGFTDHIVKDVGEYVWPTFECWKQNVVANEREIRRYFTRRQLNDFLMATDFVCDWYRSGIVGYGLIGATKPH